MVRCGASIVLDVVCDVCTFSKCVDDGQFRGVSAAM